MVYHVSTRRADYLGKDLPQPKPRIIQQGKVMMYALAALAIEIWIFLCIR